MTIVAASKSGARESRGGRRIASCSECSASKTIEHVGLMISSRNTMCAGENSSGQPNSSGSSAMPAIGTCTASTYDIARRRFA